ncbi:polysaccharide biosynthesis protein [Frankia sp. Cas4]|uniref:lipopolysaccharide biosynthesis protein n=1 Tax=Frankia sp. Cas4 TaxID=3073927 RepID=UPI002AD35C29|nr:polysaccharide biosynthesis protein [Frankia sp. Cas4]
MAIAARELIVRGLAGPGSLAVAGVVVNGGNLLVNLVLARVLNATNYGALVVQTGIFLILSMGGSALQVAVVQRDTSFPGDTRHARASWIRRLRSVGMVVVVVTCVLGLLVCGQVAAILSYPHPFAIAEAIAGAAIWVSLSVERGLLQARRAYQELAYNFVLEGAGRIVVIIGLAFAGFGVNGAGLGLIVGVLCGTAHARRRTARTTRGMTTRGMSDTRPMPALWYDTTTALGALVPLAMLQNMDVVIVGWLNPAEVGAYAAVSTACKVPVFIGLAVANFLLPEAAQRRAQGRPATTALLAAVGWVAAPGLLLVGTGVVAARPVLSAVFGPHLAAGASTLWILALAMTCLAVTLLFTNYLLGAGRREVVGVLAAGTVLTAAGLVAAGGHLVATATVGLGCQAVTATMAGIMVLRAHRPAAADLRIPVAARPPAGPGGHEPVDVSAALAPAQRAPRPAALSGSPAALFGSSARER